MTTPPEKSMELKRMKELVCKSPDIRERMVTDLRIQVRGGVYKIRTGKVAEKIMQHGIHVLSVAKADENYVA